jgi:hypothetical protein
VHHRAGLLQVLDDLLHGLEITGLADMAGGDLFNLQAEGYRPLNP